LGWNNQVSANQRGVGPVSSESLKVVVGSLLTPELQQRFRASIPQASIAFYDHDEVANNIADAEVVIAWGLTSEHLASASKLKWVQTISAGVDRIDGKTLRERGIPLTNSSGIHAPNIAEHIIAMMLSFARQLPHYVTKQQEHEWDRKWGREDGLSAFEVTDQTMLVVGLGKIGEALAVRSKGLQMRVLGTRRRLGIERMSAVDELFPLSELKARIGEADHVAITLPLTAETRGMFDAEVLRAMKPGAYLYNIGRGPIVDQDMLIELLKSGHLGGAGLDVTTPEPLPADSELWDLPNVILTPHSSGSSPKLWERATTLWIENMQRFIGGRELLNIVDVDAGY
jgi:phosphoglycerate dehydrogenase-like enzyme